MGEGCFLTENECICGALGVCFSPCGIMWLINPSHEVPVALRELENVKF